MRHPTSLIRRARAAGAALRALLGTLLLAAIAAPASAVAGPVLDRVRASGQVRVCVWPDYYGITYRHPRTGALGGLDIDLSAAFAADLGAQAVYVDSSFPTLIPDLLEQRCDVGMFAIGMLPQRKEHL